MSGRRSPSGAEGFDRGTENQPAMPTSEGAVEYVLRVMRRRWLIFLVAAIAVPVVAFLVSSSKETLYTASATLLFQSDEESFEDPERRAATNEALANLPVVAVRAAKEMGEGTSPGELLGAISASSGDSVANVVDISATSPDPERAAELANGYANAYVGFRRETEQSKVQEAIRLVERKLEDLSEEERAGSRGAGLDEQLNELLVESALQTGEAELVQPASAPSSPSSPETKRNVIVGLIFGIALGFGLAALFERFDRRIRSVEELEGLFGVPVIGYVSRSKEFPKLPMGDILLAQEAEDFRILRTNLRFFNVDRELRSILFASPEPGDGKSMVAYGLAAAMAAAGEPVLLLEGDMRKESSFRRNGYSPDGLSSVLSGLPLDEAIQHVPLSVPSAAEPRPLAVLPSGPVPPNPAELLESARMQALMEELQGRFKIVIIDSPALGVVSDALALAPYASEVLAVGGIGRTTRDGALAFMKQLALLGKPPVGMVATFTKRDRSRYSYYHRSGVAARR